MASSRRSRGATEVVVRRPDPAAWQQALTLAEGDPRRLSVQDDGSVVVHNQPVR